MSGSYDIQLQYEIRIKTEKNYIVVDLTQYINYAHITDTLMNNN